MGQGLSVQGICVSVGVWSNAQTETYVQAWFPCQVYLNTAATFYDKPVYVQPAEAINYNV